MTLTSVWEDHLDIQLKFEDDSNDRNRTSVEADLPMPTNPFNIVRSNFSDISKFIPVPGRLENGSSN